MLWSTVSRQQQDTEAVESVESWEGEGEGKSFDRRWEEVKLIIQEYWEFSPRYTLERKDGTAQYVHDYPILLYTAQLLVSTTATTLLNSDTNC